MNASPQIGARTMQPEQIELVVDEPVAGHFYWVLVKAADSDGQPRPVEQASGPMPSRSLAMMAGIAALQRRTDAKRRPSTGPEALH
jgi:hypothetical protein